MKPTIKDVARRCGVTDATVSYVLNNRKGVSEKTRERVLSAMSEMRYQPSAVARGLHQRRMNTIGVVFHIKGEGGLLQSPYFTAILDGILDGAMRARQKTLLFLERDWDAGMRESADYLDGHCDSLIFVAPVDASKYVESLFERGVPNVFIGDSGSRPSQEHSVCSVDVDNVFAARELTNHLIGLGHRKIAFLEGDIPISSVSARVAGYRSALEESGLTFEGQNIYPGRYTKSSGYERTLSLVRASGDHAPTALFCCSDVIALGALDALRELGLRVPQDVSLVGFDDMADAATSVPPLTTMRQPLREIGERAIELVLNQVEKGIVSTEQIFLPTTMIVRGSTAAPRESAPLARH